MMNGTIRNRNEAGRGRNHSGAGGGMGMLQEVEIPPIPWELEDGRTLTPRDLELFRENCYGLEDDDGNLPEYSREYRPVIPQRFVERDERVFVEEFQFQRDQSLLTPDATIPIQLLYVDQEDVMHCRFFDEHHRDVEEMVPSTVPKLLRELESYYENPENMEETSYKVNGWSPVVGEVVVVRLVRYFYKGMPRDRHPYELYEDFQLAKVVAVKTKVGGVTVELLDDHGSGGVLLENVFKIKGKFVNNILPPQVFLCELAGMEFFHWKKLLHKTLRTCPVRRTFADYTLNHLLLTFTGEYSEKGLPLVDVTIRQLSTSDWLSLKGHVLENLRFTISPFNNLLKGPAACRILQADSLGNIWTMFRNDSDVLSRMNCAFERLKPLFDVHRSYLRLTASKLVPHRKSLRNQAKNRAKGLFVALIKGYPLFGKELYCRVKILRRQPGKGSRLVEVLCIDYGITRWVNPDVIVPLSTLCADFCYIPPMAIKLHLRRVARLFTNDPIVIKGLFQQGELKAELVFEWPANAYPPDVFIYPLAEEKSEEDKEVVFDQEKVAGVAKTFIEKKGALKCDDNMMQILTNRAKEYKEEKDKVDFYKNSVNQFYESGCTFIGETFSFMWRAKKVEKKDETTDDDVAIPPRN